VKDESLTSTMDYSSVGAPPDTRVQLSRLRSSAEATAIGTNAAAFDARNSKGSQALWYGTHTRFPWHA
jgi:hypothetical protein